MNIPTEALSIAIGCTALSTFIFALHATRRIRSLTSRVSQLEEVRGPISVVVPQAAPYAYPVPPQFLQATL
jgi:hypothetical protein